MGPTAGTVQDIGQIGRAFFNNDWTKSDVRAGRRLIPYQNLIWLRQPFDEAEKRLNRRLR